MNKSKIIKFINILWLMLVTPQIISTIKELLDDEN